MAKKQLVNVTVLVEDAFKDKDSKVVSELKKLGFVLKKRMGEIGVVYGSVPTTAVGSLSSVPGVSAVEEERTDYRTQS